MLGNIVTGCSVLAPAGMLSELSDGLDVSIRTAGLLVTFGAIVLCIGSPLTAWLTSRVDRRTLLTSVLAVLAITNIASAFAPDYASLLAIRLIMLAIGVIYTPQAVGTAALIVPAERRGSTIAYVFLGWSLAAAAGLPLITIVASRYGWQAAYAGIGTFGVLSFFLLLWRLPGKLVTPPVDLRTWLDLGRNRIVVLLLAITVLQMSGQFTVFTFMGPLLKKLTDAGPDKIGLRAVRCMRLPRHCVCDPHRRFLGRLPDLAAVHIANLRRRRRLGARRRHLCVDGDLGCDLGRRLRRHQLDAAGAVGSGCAATRVGLGVAQHIRALCRAGDRFGHRRRPLCRRSPAHDGFHRGDVRRAGACHRVRNPPALPDRMTQSKMKSG